MDLHLFMCLLIDRQMDFLTNIDSSTDSSLLADGGYTAVEWSRVPPLNSSLKW